MPRVVFSLQFETERHPAGNPASTDFIVPLDPTGNTTAPIRPLSGKRRVVDLRPGDEFQHGATVYKLAKMSAYRQHQVSEEKVAGGRRGIQC